MIIEDTARQIQSKIATFKPKTAIILGSGLGEFANALSDAISIPYAEIKDFPQSNVKGHACKFIIGKLHGKDILCMQGRFHLYEGHAPARINEIILTLKLLGIEKLIVTNAAGSLHPEMPAGSLMLIKDHISLNTPNPLIGPDDEKYGPRFPDMSNAYTAEIREQIKALAAQLDIKLYEGTYYYSVGPCFETKAEIKMLQMLGGDAVGSSTVPEVIAAVHAGLKVLGISVITNLGTGLQATPPSHQETLTNAALGGEKLTRLISTYIKEAA